MGNFVSGYIMRVSDDGANYQGYLADIENTLEEFQSIVDGNIEVIRISDDVLAVLNECGKLLFVNLPAPVFSFFMQIKRRYRTKQSDIFFFRLFYPVSSCIILVM